MNMSTQRVRCSKSIRACQGFRILLVSYTKLNHLPSPWDLGYMIWRLFSISGMYISINHPIANYKGLQHQASDDTLLTSLGAPNQLVSFSPANVWGECWWRFLKAVEFEIGRMLLRCIIFHEPLFHNISGNQRWQEMIFSHFLEVLEQSSSETKKMECWGGSWSGIRMRRWRDEDVAKLPLTEAQSLIINDCFYGVIPFNSCRRVLVKRRCVIWRWFKSLWKEWLSTPKCNALSTYLHLRSWLSFRWLRCFQIKRQRCSS